MNLKKEKIISKIEQALELYKNARKNSRYDDLSDEDIPSNESMKILLLLASSIEKFAPPGSTQRKSFNEIAQKRGINSYSNFSKYVGIIESLKYEYENDLLISVQELVHADTFEDYLTMSQYLLDEGYQNPAAVIIGSSLENHLRNLAIKNGISCLENGRNKKAEKLNTELRNKSVYDLGDQKSVTSWLDLRNKAAHGKYKEYTPDQVKLMLMGVRDFANRNRA